MQKTLIIIPSRLAATRLPGKPLLKINGVSIISHVYKKAMECNIGEVFVAAEDKEILDDIKANGGQGILTKKAKDYGVVIKNNSEVIKINCNNGKCDGVSLADGQLFFSKNINYQGDTYEKTFYN